MTHSDLPQVIDNSNAQQQSHKGVAENKLHADAYLGKPVGGDDTQLIQKGGKTLTDHVMEDFKGWKEDWKKLFNPDATKEDIQKAQGELNDKMSPLVSEADRKVAQAISNAVLDGDPKALAEALSSIKDPERLKKFVEEINHNLKEANAGVSLAVDGKGHVLAYKDNGESAVDIDPKTGATTVRPISVGLDGTVTLEPGEILNGNPQKVLKDVGNTAVRNINGPQLIVEEPIHIGPHRPFHPKPWHDPGFEPFYDPKLKEPIDIPSLDPLKPISFPTGPMEPLHPWVAPKGKIDPRWLMEMNITDKSED